MNERSAEVVVVGAGFAGLAAAQVLGRAQRDVLVLGAGPTRNAEAQHAHNVLTRDGTSPDELIRLATAEVRSLSNVRVETAHVEAVEPHDGNGLRVRLSDGGSVRAEAVLVATGARDTLPDVPGLAALWGRRAHSCPFCDGAAYAGRRLLILADETRGAHSLVLLAGWTKHLTRVDPADVDSLTLVDDEVVARLHDGDELTADGVFVGVTPVPRVDCVKAMALARRGPYLAVDGEGRTSHAGLWAVGDCAWKAGESNPGGQVIASMAAGARAAAWIVFDLLDVKPPAPPPIEEPHSRNGEEQGPGDLVTFWEQHYGQQERVWSGRPNNRLVEEAGGMPPGRALDLGCGEGADAVWLAEHGWHVVAADVSPTALARAAEVAAKSRVADRIEWQRHDLGATFPDGEFDLVVAAYLLSPVTIPRTDILRAAAAAVAPGGVLLILGHTNPPAGAHAHHPEFTFLTPEEERAALALPSEEWVVEAAEEFARTGTQPDGAPTPRFDTVLRLRRRGGPGA